MKDGTIEDSQLQASTIWDVRHGQNNARLDRSAANGNRGAWCAKTNNLDQWIQVQFRTMTTVSGIILQGRGDHNQWVTKYKVQYSIDGVNWRFVRDANNSVAVRV